jgi:hypothetical protein
MTAPIACDRPTTLRLFVSAWLILTLHFATNISREHYPAIALAEHGTLAVDEYLGLHPDLFVAPSGRVVINNTPGASVLAALPLVLARPALAAAEHYARQRLPEDPSAVSATYDDPRPNRQRFFRQVRERGLDLKFGVVAVVTSAGLMAPLTALLAVVLFWLLCELGLTPVAASGYSLLGVFGTPVFFRAGYLNHNHILGLFAFFAFVILWRGPLTSRRLLLAGALAGSLVTLDYSGVVPLAFLAWWATWETPVASSARASIPAVRIRRALQFAAGAAGPLALLLAYQWWAFGNPLVVPQSLMPATEFSVTGYHGMAFPQADLVVANLFDLRFGLFAFAPILLLALPGAWFMPRHWLTTRQTVVFFVFCVLFVLFCSANQFARLQWNTGLRYLLPLVPFLYLYVVAILRRMPPALARLLAAVAIGQAWALAMVRESVPDSLVRIATSGPELPWLTVLGKMGVQYLPGVEGPPSPLPVFLACGVCLYFVWRRRRQPAAVSGAVS